MHRIFGMSVASVYKHYVAKVEKKGRTKEELDEAIRWLTQFDQATLEHHLEEKTTFQDFFDAAEWGKAEKYFRLVSSLQV